MSQECGWIDDTKVRGGVGYIASLAYVVKVDDDAIYLSHSISSTKQSYHVFGVPWGCIQLMEKLPLKWNRTPKQ